MSSEASRTPSGSGSSTTGPVPTTVPEPAPAAADIARRAREVREAMARRSNTAPARGGQRGFMELYANLVRNPTKATLLNTASDLKEVRQGALRNWGEDIGRRLELGEDVPSLVDTTKGYIRMYLSPAERRQLVDQRLFGGRNRKTRKGKSRRRYTRRR